MDAVDALEQHLVCCELVQLAGNGCGMRERGCWRGWAGKRAFEARTPLRCGVGGRGTQCMRQAAELTFAVEQIQLREALAKLVQITVLQCNPCVGFVRFDHKLVSQRGGRQ